jgi:nucleoside 2-deoxyribosyltransferase
MNKQLVVYVAGLISGYPYEEVFKYFDNTSKILSALGYEVLSPLNGKTRLRTEIKLKASGYENDPISNNHAIMRRDMWMVHKADFIFCNLSNAASVSIGSMMELAWAYRAGKQVIVIMEKDNIHRHAFVLEAATIVFESLEDGLQYMRQFLS